MKHPLKARIRAEAGSVRVEIFDDIGAGPWAAGYGPGELAAKLSGVKGALDVHLNSGGGDVFDGMAIYNTLSAHPGPVTVTVDGLAASIASVILQAGTRRVVQPGSLVMVHDAFGTVTGNAAEVAKFQATLDKVSDQIAGVYAGRAGGSAAGWRDTMRAETWYDAGEAVAAGLADEVGTGSAGLSPQVDLAALDVVPGRIAARLRAMPVLAADTSGGSDGEDDGKVECPTCHGTGKILEGHRKCPDCGGTGRVTPEKAADLEDAWRHRLRNADTSGPPPCKMCGGKGRLRHPGTGKNSVVCPGCKGTGVYDPDHDGDDDSTAAGDTDHDYAGAYSRRPRNADKYQQADRDRMAKSGEAMPDGSYPIADEEDLGNAIHAVGRGNADHDAIRQHIIKRAKALGASDQIPDNWNADGSLADASNKTRLNFSGVDLEQLSAQLKGVFR